MEIKDDLIAFRIRQFFTNCMESYVSVENRVILISHCGVFSQDLINSLVEGNEELMSSVGDKKILIKRVFSILIEGLQNIRAHGEKDENGKQIAFVLIAKEKDTYKLNLGNIINSIDVHKFFSHIESSLRKIESFSLLGDVWCHSGLFSISFRPLPLIVLAITALGFVSSIFRSASKI